MTLIETVKKTMKATLLKRSYRLIVRHAKRPTKNVKTFHGRTNADIESTVMTNDE